MVDDEVGREKYDRERGNINYNKLDDDYDNDVVKIKVTCFIMIKRTRNGQDNNTNNWDPKRHTFLDKLEL